MNSSFLFLPNLTKSQNDTLFTNHANHVLIRKPKEFTFPFIENMGQTTQEIAFYTHTMAGQVYITNSGEIIFNTPVVKQKYPFITTDQFVSCNKLKEQFITQNDLFFIGKDKSSTSINVFRGGFSQKNGAKISAFNTIYFEDIYDGIDLYMNKKKNNIEKVFTIEPYANPGDIKVLISGVDDLQINDFGELEVKIATNTISFTNPIAYQVINGIKEFIEVEYSVINNIYGFIVGEYNCNYSLVIDPLLASTYIGGTSSDYGSSIALDNEGNVFIVGYTQSNDLPVTNGALDDTHNGSMDIMVAKLDTSLTIVKAITYIGGSQVDRSPRLALDNNGLVYLAGRTFSEDFPTTTGTFKEIYTGPGDGFATILSNDLSTLIASTFIGNIGTNGYIQSIQINNNDDVYISGSTNSDNFPTTPGAFDETYNGFSSDCFIAKLNSDLSSLLSSTYFGGGESEGCACTLNDNSNVFLTGYTFSEDFPITSGVFDETLNGNSDAFISILNSELSSLISSTYLGGSSSDDANCISIDSDGKIFISGSSASPNFPTTTPAFDTLHNGEYDIFISKLSNDLTSLEASSFLGGEGTETGYSLAINDDDELFVYGSNR